MNKTLAWTLVGLALAAVAAFLIWGLFALRGAGSWTGGSWSLGLVIVFGVLFTGALTGFFMWLAFYSSRKGYDERAIFRPGEDGDEP